MAGAGSTTSSLTSTSHTLSHAPAMAQAVAQSESGSAVTVFLDSTFPSNRHAFLRPSPLLPAGSLQLAKETLDALAGQVADQQQQRLRDAGKKRKRDGAQDKAAVLKIRKLHIDGFETGQVWQQAKKIVTSVLQESAQVLGELEENGEVAHGAGEDAEDAAAIEFGEDGFEVDSEEEDESASDGDTEESDDEGARLGDEDEEMFDLEAEDDEERREEGDEDDEEDAEEVEDGEEEGEEGEDGYDDEPEEELVEDPNGLNDGFFSIDDFNKQTQWFEDQDARADPNTDHFSDDESVDWHGDPFSAKKPRKKGGDEDGEDESEMELDEDDDEDEEGPAVSKKDLLEALDDDNNDGEGNLDDDLNDMGLDLTANDIYYKDFFAQPRKKKKPGSFKPRRNLPEASRPDDADVERAENDVRRDLFDDLSERSDSEDALSDVSAGDPKSRRSAHDRRQAKVAEEIRKLEAELVAKRAWTLSGEATAVDRPVNSLLEEDMDFEHVGKPVPVITEDVSESIEELIKRRILAQEFDEVLRRRPDTLGNPSDARRGLVDVDDTKGKQSLAEIYEEEHVKKANPDAYVSQADEKLRRDEEEIKNMWKDVSARLDALSSWHYKPKPAAPTLTVVADVATVAMEDAQPTTAQGVAGGESMIAPQEVYAPGRDTAEKGEVVAKSGLPVAKQEMSREEKLRRRRRDKERIRKAGGLDANKPASKKAQAQRETMTDLKKGGVKIINRKGEVVGLDGKKVVEQKGPQSSGAFKL
ncbi:Mpp10 protein-domain-containing protein [Parachaetomium inaequale]|uniref:U3 small nucleolar ribonucleoprotein protein MPP10 n=1 Tax=Parachaetomium inaequale TaxID=2588326 RepID=A0AAN6SUK4_9PEZI|nr:Mpp10 protein-domain-containing protein [Parachaetomium inaequale]